MPQQDADIPKFGHWENNRESSDFTEFFDKAHKDPSKQKAVNQRGSSQLNPGLDSHPSDFAQAPADKAMADDEANSPVQKHHELDCGGSNNPPTKKKSARSENSSHHARTLARGNASPSPGREGKSSRDRAHGTPGRSRLRQEIDNTHHRSAAIPKFGTWNDDSQLDHSATRFTVIFNKVREEKHNQLGYPTNPVEVPPGNLQKESPHSRSKKCCFPWGKK